MSGVSFSDGEATRRRSAASGRWLVFFATVFWGTTATLARFVFRDRQVSAFTVVELRLAIATLLLLPWLAWRRPAALRIEPRDRGYFLVLGLFGVAAVQGSYYFAISKLGVGLAILLQYLAPSLIVLWDVLRGRRPSPRVVLAVALALAGTALLVRGVDPRALHARPWHWAVGFASAVIFAFYILHSKRGLARYPPETVLVYTFGVAAVFWGVVTPPWTILRAGYPADLWGIFLALGVFSTLVPFALFYAGLRRLPAVEAGIIATSEPLVAMLAAWGFLHETLGPAQMVGAALVIGAALLAARESPGASAPAT